MKLITSARFRKEYFEPGSRPSRAQVREWVESGAVIGKVLGDDVFVDENRWITAGMSKWTGHMADPIVHQIHDGSFDSGIQGLSTSKEGHLLDSAVSVDKKQLATIHAGFGRSGNTFRKGIGKSGWLRIWDLDSGDLGVLCSFGAGYSIGSLVVKKR